MEIAAPGVGVDAPPGFRAAVAQVEPRIGEAGPNREWAWAQVQRAAQAGAALVVLPALAVTGHTFADHSELRTLAESLDGESVAGLCETCARAGVTAVLGVAELTPEGVHNSAAVVGPDGVRGVARARGLSVPERRIFAAGDGPVVVECEVGRLGVVVGADASSPSAQHDLVMTGAEIICAPTAWVVGAHAGDEEGDLAVRRVGRLAHAAGVPLLVADRVGIERGREFAGRSVILDATGQPLAGPASATDEELLVADVAKGALDVHAA